MTKSRQIANMITNDLMSRKGLGDELESIDSETFNEMFNKWVEKIDEILGEKE